jgi:hypothetical protein
MKTSTPYEYGIRGMDIKIIVIIILTAVIGIIIIIIIIIIITIITGKTAFLFYKKR